ncbi:hypothetical protein [Silvibacterium dinghuense]|uniref:Glycerophosphoryl diester phosphodiesterase membrane domain-containing protein n=1 Tax=Silvibacterium dinghuense TaxID=1560006 RepID=A0A4Q1SH00_9BACT|nr:hypothetical protein [Silvibacterium dinghuense]RXS96627.1 hypothetical protein ESZ00_01365 [Silvibacterium dinghuense]GGG92348.1 hypothetical protein GCM10011586_03790 [Silvibacterium dinghuense]
MASGTDWTHSANSPHVQPPRALTYDLRPLSTGEILDRTFQIYRSRFSLFAGLAAIAAGTSVAMQIIQLLVSAHNGTAAHPGPALYRSQITNGVITLLASVISLVVYGVVQAATTSAVSSLYLGEATSTGTAFARAREHWLRYVVIVLRQVLTGFWPFLGLVVAAFVVQGVGHRSASSLVISGFIFFAAFLSLIYCLWAYIRVSLAVPASIVESLRVGAALKRSRKLLVDRKVRVFLVLLFLGVLYIVIGAIQTPLAILALRSRGSQAFLIHTITLTLSFISGTLIGPIGAIALCLLYIDERVRREGFDIEWMMGRIAPPAPGTIPQSAPEGTQPF